jgi:DNA-binding SARP family transcriptional activator/tetratricopeptide (TPR) repeat protein
MIELRTFGGVDLRKGSDRLDKVLAQPKRVALLAYLALSRPPAYPSRDTLVSLFWPESDTRRARSSLRKALYFLRRHLGKSALTSTGDAVGLSDDVWCDATAFDRALADGDARKALELYRGALLSGFHVSNAPEFEHWLDGERRRLRNVAVRAAWQLAEEEESRGSGMEAARFGRRALALQPLDEPGVRRMMGLLHRFGDRAGALRIYEQAETRLRSELGVEPAQETRALRDRIVDAGTEAAAPSERAPVPGESAEKAPIETNGVAISAPDEPPTEPPPARPSVPHTRGWPPAAIVVSVLTGLVLLAGVLSLRSEQSDVPILFGKSSASPVAVLPFAVGGEGERLWQEGMVTLLSASFNGVAGLRAREPEYVLKLWQSEFNNAIPTPEMARLAGDELEADWVVTGSLLRHGERIRLSAEAQRVRDGWSAGAVAVDGAQDSLFLLVDRLTVELLRRGVAPVDQQSFPVSLARVTTSSLPALEAYLKGEQAWRSAELREAGAHFSEAVRHDSTFALAHYRLAVANKWNGPTGSVLPRLRAAARHAYRLQDREAALVRGELAVEEGRIAAGLDSLRTLTSRYPNYAEGWLRLGDAYLHHGLQLLVPLDDFRHAFHNAIEANPLAPEPYWHLIDDAFFREDSAQVARLVDEYRLVDPMSEACIGYETAQLLVWGDAEGRQFAESRMDTLGGGPREALTCAMTVLVLAPYYRPALDKVAAELQSADRPESERRRPRRFITRSNIRSGRLTEARSQLSSLYNREERGAAARTVVLLDLVGYPDPEATIAARKVLAEQPGPEARFWLGALAVERGRWNEVRRLSASLRADTGSTAPMSHDLALALDALASRAAEGVSDVRTLAAVQARFRGDGLIREWLRLTIGQRLLEEGEPAGALRYLESLPMYSYALLAPSFLLQGKAYEEVGNARAARFAYDRFLRWWQNSDPELDPVKEQARAALQRLSPGG